MKAYKIKVEIKPLDGFNVRKLEEELKYNLDKVNYKLMSCKFEKGHRNMFSYCILIENDVNYLVAVESIYSIKNSKYPLFKLGEFEKIKVIDL